MELENIDEQSALNSSNDANGIMDLMNLYQYSYDIEIRNIQYCFCCSLRTAGILIFTFHFLISLIVLSFTIFLSIISSFEQEFIFGIILFSIYVIVVTAGFYGILYGKAGCMMLYFVFFLTMSLTYVIFTLNVMISIESLTNEIFGFIIIWYLTAFYSLYIVWKIYIAIEKTQFNIFLLTTTTS